MKNRVLAGWHFMRFLRLLIGVFILAQGIVARDWLIGTMGMFFAGMAVWNIDCCAGGSCTPGRGNEGSIAEKTEDISYEEVH